MRWTLRAILAGGLVAGVLDLADALLFFGHLGIPPARVCQSITAGLLGPSAFQGGAATVALGVALHFFISIGAATTFVLSARRLGILVRYAWVSGPLFGIAVYVFMEHAVIPLSAIGPQPAPSWPVLLNGLLIHALGIGLPIALIARRMLAAERTTSTEGRSGPWS